MECGDLTPLSAARTGAPPENSHELEFIVKSGVNRRTPKFMTFSEVFRLVFGLMASLFAAGRALAQSATLTAPAATCSTAAGWSTSPDASAVATAAAQSGAFPFTANSLDAAVIVNLSPGGYSVQVTGVGGTSGAAMVEVYEVP